MEENKRRKLNLHEQVKRRKKEKKKKKKKKKRKKGICYTYNIVKSQLVWFSPIF